LTLAAFWGLPTVAILLALLLDRADANAFLLDWWAWQRARRL